MDANSSKIELQRNFSSKLLKQHIEAIADLHNYAQNTHSLTQFSQIFLKSQVAMEKIYHSTHWVKCQQ